MNIDLNADLGEGGDADEALLGLVSSANIACGWHAGGANAMRDCVRLAVQRGVAIGAHPSFHDPANFGRKEMHLPPDDIYAGNLITALGCIDAGITCVIDNSHNSRSGAHSDAAIKALFDSGIRGVHAAGPPQAGDWDHQLPQDLARLCAAVDELVQLSAASSAANPVR